MQEQMPTSLPGKLFTFPTFSDTDIDSATCDKLSLSETESSTSYRLLPEDTDFLPFQDHTRHLPRPSHIPVPIKQLTKTCSTQSKQNKDTTSIPKAKPSCIPVYKDNKCTPVIRDSHLNISKELQTSSRPITSSDQNYHETAYTRVKSQTRKTPLLPTPTMPAQQHMTRTLISGPSQQNSNRYQHNPYFPRPQNAPISQRQ